MLKFLQPKTYALAGIDISSSSLKVMQLRRIGDGYAIQHYAHEMLEPNAIVNKEIKNPSQVVAALRALFLKAGIETRHIAFALSGNAVVTRIIQLDSSLKEREILAQLEVDAEKFLPYPLEQLYLDFQILHQQSAKGPNLMDVQIAAVRKEYLEQYLDVMQEANLIPEIVDIEAFAIERSFNLIKHFLPDQGKDLKVALVDIGAQVTNIHIFLNGEIVYSKEQNFGGGQLTEEIQRRYNLSYDEALAAQINHTLPDDFYGEVLEPFKELTAQQIHRAIQLYYTAEQQSLIDYIALAGGTVNVPGLDEIIYAVTNTKTFVVDPCIDMHTDSSITSSHFNFEGPKLLVCTGLAMRGMP